MHVVIENDDPHHHPHAEEKRVLTVKPACILSVKEKHNEISHNEPYFILISYRQIFKT